MKLSALSRPHPAPGPEAERTPRSAPAPVASRARPLDTFVGTNGATLEQERAALAEHLPRLDPDKVRALPLVRDDEAQTRGTSVKWVLEAGKQRFTFKPQLPDSTNTERELFALTVRTLAGQPAVPVISHRATDAQGQSWDGYLKPRLKGDGDLPSDPRRWSESVVNTVLADHVFGELLGNYDNKPRQYKALESKALGETVAVHADWDATLRGYLEPDALDRFQNGPYVSPSAHALLYKAYVHGDVALDFAATRDAVARLAAVPDAEVLRALEPFLARTFADGGHFGRFETREQLCAAVLERKHGLSTRFEALVSSLEHERADRQRGPSLSWKRLKDNVRDLKMGVMRRVVDSPLFEWWNDRKKASNAQRGAND
jgi:hypothetical protein